MDLRDGGVVRVQTLEVRFRIEKDEENREFPSVCNIIRSSLLAHLLRAPCLLLQSSPDTDHIVFTFQK
jgi:hypothetical protein